MKRYYDPINNRLVYFGEAASPDFWDRLYDTEHFKDDVERGKDDRFILKTLQKYLPDKRGHILDGGCGEGRIVYCMYAHGYKATGVDSAVRVVEKTREMFPQLDIQRGNVTDLPFPDSSFAGYWSVGVIEHFRDGYGGVIKEMKRVVTDGGYIFLIFPSMSPLRKLKAKLGLYPRVNSNNLKELFYQYVMDPGSVAGEFEAIGFDLVERKLMAGIKGLKDEVALCRPLLQKLFDYRGDNIFIRGIRYLLDMALAVFAGHTTFLVLRKAH